MFKKLLTLSALIVGLGASSLWARDVAYILRNNAYDSLPDLPGRSAQNRLENLLDQNGFHVLQQVNASAHDMTRGARRFKTMLDGETDRAVIYLSGHTISALGNAWFMGVKASRPDGFSVTRQSMSLNALLALLSDHQGRAVVVIDLPDRDLPLPDDLQQGLQNLAIPQGVTVIQTTSSDGPEVLHKLLTPGVSIADLRDQMPDGVRIAGYAADTHMFSPTDNALPTTLREDTYFDIARDIGTIRALQAYLDRYPWGRHVGEANRLIAALEGDRMNDIQDEERALNLTRDQRRRIQDNLTILGHDTRGVDGVFGRGTRSAIASWQTAEGLNATGYLTSAQITRLERHATNRRKEIDTARKAEERNAWLLASEENTIASYRRYLAEYPEGQYREKALKRLNKLGYVWVDEDAIAKARKEEAKQLNNPFTRMLAEQRLAFLGFNTGRIDGVFDDDTRAAIKAFQKRQSLVETGYIGNKTLAELLP